MISNLILRIFLTLSLSFAAIEIVDNLMAEPLSLSNSEVSSQDCHEKKVIASIIAYSKIIQLAVSDYYSNELVSYPQEASVPFKKTLNNFSRVSDACFKVASNYYCEPYYDKAEMSSWSLIMDAEYRNQSFSVPLEKALEEIRKIPDNIDCLGLSRSLSVYLPQFLILSFHMEEKVGQRVRQKLINAKSYLPRVEELCCQVKAYNIAFYDDKF